MTSASNHLGNLAILSPYEHIKLCQVPYVRHNLKEHIAQHLPNLEYVTHFERHHKQVVFLRDKATGLLTMAIEGSVPPTALDIIRNPRRFGAHWFRNLEDGIGTSSATSFGKEIAKVQEAVGKVDVTSNHSGAAFVASHADVRDQLDEAAKLAIAPHIKQPDEDTVIIRPEHCPLDDPILNRHGHQEYRVPGEHGLKSIKETHVSPFDLDDESIDLSRYGVISPDTRWGDIHPDLGYLDFIEGVDQGPKRAAHQIQARRNRYEALKQRSRWNLSRLKKGHVLEDIERLEDDFKRAYGMTVEEFQIKEREQLPVKQVSANAYPQASFNSVEEAQAHFEKVIQEEIYAKKAKKGEPCNKHGHPKSHRERTKAKDKAAKEVLTDPRFLKEAEAIRAKNRADQEVAMGRAVIAPVDKIDHDPKVDDVSPSQDSEPTPKVETGSEEESQPLPKEGEDDVAHVGALSGVAQTASHTFFSSLTHHVFFTSFTNYLKAPEDRQSASEMACEVITESASSAVQSGALHFVGNIVGHGVVGFLGATVTVGTQLVTAGRNVYQLFTNTTVEEKTLITLPLDQRMCCALTPLEPPVLADMPGVTGSVLRKRSERRASHMPQEDLDDLILQQFKRG